MTVLSYQNTSDEVLVCQGLIRIGDGVNDLDGSGGDFELTLQFGDRVTQPDPQLMYFSTATQASVFTAQFPLPIGETVTFKMKSPNAGDSSVWVQACIYEVSSPPKMSYGVPGGGTIINTYDTTGGVYSYG